LESTKWDNSNTTWKSNTVASSVKIIQYLFSIEQIEQMGSVNMIY